MLVRIGMCCAFLLSLCGLFLNALILYDFQQSLPHWLLMALSENVTGVLFIWLVFTFAVVVTQLVLSARPALRFSLLRAVTVGSILSLGQTAWWAMTPLVRTFTFFAQCIELGSMFTTLYASFSTLVLITVVVREGRETWHTRIAVFD